MAQYTHSKECFKTCLSVKGMGNVSWAGASTVGTNGCFLNQKYLLYLLKKIVPFPAYKVESNITKRELTKKKQMDHK